MICSYFNVISQTTEERKLKPFDKLKISSEVKVFLTKGAEEMVKIVATGIELSEIETSVIGKTLTIELSRGIHMGVSIEIFVTYKQIRDISVSSSGKLSVQTPLVGDKVLIDASSNGEIDAELNLNTVDLNIGQGGVIRLTGKTGSIDAKVSTKGILSAIDLKSDSTYVQVGTLGIAKVSASYILESNVSMGGTLTYSGNPKVKNIKTGIGATVNAIE